MTGIHLTAEEWVALQRAALLAGPLLAAFALLLICKPQPREAVGAMVAFLWQLPALLSLHLLAAQFHWWSFGGQGNALVGLPIDVWIGWAIWWGPVVVFANRWLTLPLLVVLSVMIDLATMTRLTPLVELGPLWIVGDAVAVVLCLAPGLWMARLTRDDRSPKRRAMFHVLGWGSYIMLVIPVSVLSYLGAPLTSFYHWPHGILEWCLIAAGLMLLFIGIAATIEFACVGDGTPIPFDPPKRVVTSGPYAFTANPMQIISAFFMAIMALYARSWGLAFVALMFAIFDTVYATWYNRVNIANAMPQPWSDYRMSVSEWRVRWQPHIPGAAEVTISPSGPARAVWDRVWPSLSRRLHGSFVVGSEPRGQFSRLAYRRPDASVEDHGIKAAARLLGHGPLPLAMLAWLIRFPYLGGAFQRLSWLTIKLWRYRAGVR